MKFDKDCEVLWKDRKRHLGLPISFYRYYIVRKNGPDGWLKIFRHKGFFSAVIDEINLYRCYDVSMRISLFDRIFGTGTIRILSNDASTPYFHFRHIADTYKVRDLVSGLMETERRRKNVGVTEFQVH